MTRFLSRWSADQLYFESAIAAVTGALAVCLIRLSPISEQFTGNILYCYTWLGLDFVYGSAYPILFALAPFVPLHLWHRPRGAATARDRKFAGWVNGSAILGVALALFAVYEPIIRFGYEW